MKKALIAEGIIYSYPGRPRALKGLNACFAAGLTLLVGANASGKSTLLRLLSGMVYPASGRFLKGDGAELGPVELREQSRLVIQDADPQILGPTVAEDVELGRSISGLGRRFTAEAERLAARLGLDRHWSAPVETLSFGQKRKLNLMNAMLAGPRLLLLDEPFEGLDYPSARELREFIAENRSVGVNQIVSTHDLEPLLALADWLVVVRDGVTAAEGEPGELADKLARWSVRPPGGAWT